ncbi:hypothetical protein OS493_019154 [Desmophyllum pertusum]|uniref:Hexosyltransferase n=1 Tax=Desmophyllum pertusum TaxID=174260 RepID=A0A9W9YNG2_9CNID|nr:hypothetical protein OS493_019154 [Desmophyllum pertusum]
MVDFRRIFVLFGRRLTSKRRFVVVLASIPFLGYLLLFTSSRSITVPVTPISTNIAGDCPCATRQQTAENDAVKPHLDALTRERKVQNHSLSSDVRLSVHMWSGVCGMEVDILRNWPHFPYFPDKRSFISEFQRTQVPATNNNGERIFGFIHPQRSGEYYFAISSDDTSELWLSPNEDPASSEMIARVYSPKESAWTEKGDYKKYPDQISKGITLHAYKKYYIESLSKQGSGDAHVSVYWSLYNNSTLEIISSKYLSSFSENNNRESIPQHAGKQTNTWLQSKSKSYFNRLPFISKKEYIRHIPTCPYSPSFVVRKVDHYQGVWLTKESEVFPQDDTDMSKGGGKKDWMQPNPLVNKSRVESVVDKLINSLQSGKYFLKKIHNVIHKPDPKNGSRFLLNLELGLNSNNQSFRLSEHVYQKEGSGILCLPEGITWNNSATVYFILPVKDQGNWVHHFINQLTEASLSTGDTNFHVIIIDFESKDVDIGKVFNTSLLSRRHTIVSLTGKFYKTLALNQAAELVPNAHDIIFLFDLHIDVPTDIMDSVRMNTIAGRMAYFPIVGRLDCESTSAKHRGFWQMNGYGIMSVYKSDWERFGGMNVEDYKYSWGGEDWDLLDRVMRLSMEVERIKYPGLYHHYHAKQKKWN